MSVITGQNLVDATAIMINLEQPITNIDMVCKKLRYDTLKKFYKKYKGMNKTIAIQIPENGAMLYNLLSLCDCLRFMGINAWAIMDDVIINLKDLNPDVFITCANPSFTDKVDIEELKKLKDNVQIGVFGDDNPKEEFLEIANFIIAQDNRKKTEDVCMYDLYFSPLNFYNMSVKKVVDFFHAGQPSFNKQDRFDKYIKPIADKNKGIFAGMLWENSVGVLSQKQTNIFYNLAQVNPNLHMQSQIENPTDLNERTYIIAATGNIQLIDNPALLKPKYGNLFKDFSFSTPEDYIEAFYYYLDEKHAEEKEEQVIKIMEKTWKNYTMFHVVDELMRFVGE